MTEEGGGINDQIGRELWKKGQVLWNEKEHHL